MLFSREEPTSEQKSDNSPLPSFNLGAKPLLPSLKSKSRAEPGGKESAAGGSIVKADRARMAKAFNSAKASERPSHFVCVQGVGEVSHLRQEEGGERETYD